jgi:hypothetical protein
MPQLGSEHPTSFKSIAKCHSSHPTAYKFFTPVALAIHPDRLYLETPSFLKVNARTRESQFHRRAKPAPGTKE